MEDKIKVFQITKDEADTLSVLLAENKVSISGIQRKLGYGWPKAAKAIDTLLQLGVIEKIEKTNYYHAIVGNETLKKYIDECVEEQVKFSVSKDVLLALALMVVQNEQFVDNVKLQTKFGWKSSRALKVISNLNQIQGFTQIDEDTVMYNDRIEKLKKIIDKAEVNE